MSLPVLSEASNILRARGWAVRAAVHRDARLIIALLPAGTAPLGAAIDVGTTKLAAYLVNLETGQTMAKGAAPNPQAALGEDVMSRIAYADASEAAARDLHSRLRTASTGCSASCVTRLAPRPHSWSMPWRWAIRPCTTCLPACRSASWAGRRTCPR